MQGTTDLTRYTALPKALDFYSSIGGRQAIFDYVDPLLEWAVDLLCNALKTKRQEIPESMRAPYMRVLGNNWLLQTSRHTYLKKSRVMKLKIFFLCWFKSQKMVVLA